MNGKSKMAARGYLLLSLLTMMVCTFFIASECPAFAADGVPQIGSVSVDTVGVGIAKLHANINPNGLDTSYYFEYGETASYGKRLPLVPREIGAGTEEVFVAEMLSGLATGTKYHFRLVAENSLGSVTSDDQVFSTFGIETFTSSVEGAEGSSGAQAGSHPYAVTTAIKFSEAVTDGAYELGGGPRELEMVLPTGIGSDPAAVPQCPDVLLRGEGGGFGQSNCPPDTQLGVMTAEIGNGNNEPEIITMPLYNLVPPAGVTAEFGAYPLVLPLVFDAVLRPERQYAVSVDISNITQIFEIHGMSLTLWGVPAASSHDKERGHCLLESPRGVHNCPSEATPKPFLTLPTVCGKPLTWHVRADSWAEPADMIESSVSSSNGMGSEDLLTGCDLLDFKPSLGIQTDTASADSPTGLSVDIGIPQEENIAGLGEANLKKISVTLPEGMSINPASTDGLGACTLAEIALESMTQPSCPNSSKIGSAEVDTSVLSTPLVGSLYLAQPGENPFNAQLAAYIVAEAEGVIIKLPTQLISNPITGQVTVVVDNIPQVEFSTLKLNFDGGPRAPIATPNGCGTVTATGRLTSYAAFANNEEDTLPDNLLFDSNCGKGFTPSFVAGTTSTGAGENTEMTLQVGRADGEQTIHSLSATFPAGLVAKVGTVPLCEGASAAAGTCASASEVGTVVVGVGAGSHPAYLSGKAFLTGPYEGAPFGLSILLPIKLGPFNFGTVVLRARLSVNPRDARLTIATDALPTVLQGIVLRLRSIDITVNRSGFMSNPTSCVGQHVTATVVGAPTVTEVSSPFDVSGCTRLPFSPSVYSSTQGHVSLKDGAAFALEVRSSSGIHANLGGLKLVMPGQLSSRLSTIQQACRRTVFDDNPALCPAGSHVGTSEASTALLKGPLRGPVYLVSNGRKARPNFVVILQGEGVTLEVIGTLEVGKNNTLTVTFGSIPDAPISVLGIKLPAGPGSVLGANGLSKASGSLCGKKLVLQSTLTGQNGIQVKRSDRLSIAGCVHASASKKRK